MSRLGWRCLSRPGGWPPGRPGCDGWRIGGKRSGGVCWRQGWRGRVGRQRRIGRQGRGGRRVGRFWREGRRQGAGGGDGRREGGLGCARGRRGGAGLSLRSQLRDRASHEHPDQTDANENDETFPHDVPLGMPMPGPGMWQRVMGIINRLRPFGKSWICRSGGGVGGRILDIGGWIVEDRGAVIESSLDIFFRETIIVCFDGRWTKRTTDGQDWRIPKAGRK